MTSAPLRTYQQTVHYLQHRLSALEAITAATRILKRAYVRLAVPDPSSSVRELEEVRACIEVALREARAMANLDDAAPVTPPVAEPAA